MWAQWAIAIAFLGVTIGAIVQFNVLTSEQKKKYRWWFILSLVIIWVGTILQLVATTPLI